MSIPTIPQFDVPNIAGAGQAIANFGKDYEAQKTAVLNRYLLQQQVQRLQQFQAQSDALDKSTFTNTNPAPIDANMADAKWLDSPAADAYFQALAAKNANNPPTPEQLDDLNNPQANAYFAKQAAPIQAGTDAQQAYINSQLPSIIASQTPNAMSKVSNQAQALSDKIKAAQDPTTGDPKTLAMLMDYATKNGYTMPSVGDSGQQQTPDMYNGMQDIINKAIPNNPPNNNIAGSVLSQNPQLPDMNTRLENIGTQATDAATAEQAQQQSALAQQLQGNLYDAEQGRDAGVSELQKQSQADHDNFTPDYTKYMQGIQKLGTEFPEQIATLQPLAEQVNNYVGAKATQNSILSTLDSIPDKITLAVDANGNPLANPQTIDTTQYKAALRMAITT